MNSLVSVRPNVEQTLSRLKDFQRDTVDYIFQRLYLDTDSASRFLIADEVGLGKTLVARGLIAKAVDHLWDTIDRIDVLYICSNQEIARQNIDRLNITADRKFQLASRATLLPVTLKQLKGNKLNFVSFTPGTSFKLHSTSGVAKERWVLYHLLMEHWKLHKPTCRNVLRAGVKKGNFGPLIEWYEQNEEIDEDLAKAFFLELDGRPQLRKTYEILAENIGYRRHHIPVEVRRERDAWIGNLRRLLARSSLTALEPDIVVLDEFQRFKYLLDEENPVSLLAREIFDFPDVKVLLLSATPYKMYSLAWEREDDHYEDFYRTIKFLFNGDDQALRDLEKGVSAYREAYLQLGISGKEQISKAKHDLEAILKKVMVRTERLAVSEDRNGMLDERCSGQDQIHPRDLSAFVKLDRIARHMRAGDQVEYWKSTAYPLNLMEGYKVKRQLKEALENEEGGDLSKLLRDAEPHFLKWKDIQAYKEIDPENARLRELFEDSLETGNWRWLWMPPSLPYYRPVGVFKKAGKAGSTKSLVFSSWRVVPKVIAVLTSYEAERRMLGDGKQELEYSEFTRRRRPLLNFAMSKGRLVGMPIFCLTYPCWTFANAIDPLKISLSLYKDKTPSHTDVFRSVRDEIRRMLKDVSKDWPVEESRVADSRWYWAAPGILDWAHHRELVEKWFDTEDRNLRWESMVRDDDGDGETRYAEHVRSFIALLQEHKPLGKQPKDLTDVLARIALAGPATSVLRSMQRVLHPQDMDQKVTLLRSAARVGLAFRALFNQPDAISLINNIYKSYPYWRKALYYAHDGNLQAVMDEYVHVLNESLGLMDHDAGESAEKLSEMMSKAISLRSPSLGFDEIKRKPFSSHYSLQPHRVRCRYALRFGDEKAEGVEEWTRSADVRIAFNSPFRPFVLATTSIGQEGLDFHQYCHRVVHWNLPSNPVDLEQREGRVHRYKGHVIRRNIALKYGLGELKSSEGELDDPWEFLFVQARSDCPDGVNELYPFWIFDVDKGYKIERRIPVLPLSREIGQLEWLKKTLVAYRSVMGQPRQEDLLAFLTRRLDGDELAEFVENSRIDLSPPARTVD